jgi:hypothetical protein
MNGGNSLSSYRNAYFFTAANAYGRLPSSTIRFSDFRSKGKRANVAAGSFSILGNGSTTIGVVNTLEIDIAGAGGGGSGSNGNYSAGAAGGNGGSTTFSTPIGTLTAAGGGGAPSDGVNGANGTNYDTISNYPFGGTSGNGVNKGGAGGRYTPRIVLNAATNFDAIAAWFSRTVTANCGVGGAGGAGGVNQIPVFNFQGQLIGYNYPQVASGSAGTDGVVAIYWT